MEKIKNRLTDLYRGRKFIENKITDHLRYNTDQNVINECVITLTEYRGRIQELEWLMNSTDLSNLKTELGEK